MTKRAGDLSDDPEFQRLRERLVFMRHQTLQGLAEDALEEVTLKRAAILPAADLNMIDLVFGHTKPGGGSADANTTASIHPRMINGMWPQVSTFD